MKKALILLLITTATLATWAQHTVSGTITDRNTGETLIGATVYDTVSKKGTVTNQHGRYTLTLKDKRAVLRFSFVGYEPQFVAADMSQNQRFDIQLYGTTTLAEVRIVGQKTEHVESSQTSLIEIPVEQVKAVPVLFGETDIIKAVQLLPGVQSGSEGTSGMYVRGGGPDENLFLLDGVPMYNVNHLGGFFSAFNSDAVKNISLYKGSFPAHFSSRLSSVLDITTNNGNDKEYHGGLSIGAISAKFNFEGPIIKEKTTFSISGRRTYADALLQPIIALATTMEGITEKVNAGYYFYDLNAKVTHKFNDRSRLYASYYMGDDRIYARMQSGFSYTTREYLKMGYNWGNIVGSLRWNYELNPKLFMNVTGSYTRYRNDMNIGMEFVDRNYLEEVAVGHNSGIQDFSARVDFDYTPSPDHAVKFGGQMLHHIFTPETQSLHLVDSMSSINNRMDTVLGQSIIHAEEMMIYAEDDWRINDWLKVNAGLNFTGFAVQGTFYPSIQPRLSGRILITDRLSAKVGYAYMTQYLHLLSNSSISLPSDLWVPVTARIKPMNSNQVAAGLFYNLLDSLNLSVEGYYKYMNNLLEYQDGASFFGSSQGWEDKVAMGRGWSYGVEFLAQKTLGRFTGWLGYTWSHTDRKFDREGNIINQGNTFPAKYDRRHDVSLVLTYKFNEKIDASLSWVFSTGNACTLAMEDIDASEDGMDDDDYYYYDRSIPYVSSRNNYRMPNYHRMDVSVNFHKKLKYGKQTINISVYNLYNRQNPYLIYKSYQYGFMDDYQVLKQLSIFPIIPSISYSWHF
ncbi:MAG: TonB-dependent receptor [Bacteroidales bacterium]|nr:TonB-dependent receptor [Bacteroidales bacterium]